MAPHTTFIFFFPHIRMNGLDFDGLEVVVRSHECYTLDRNTFFDFLHAGWIKAWIFKNVPFKLQSGKKKTQASITFISKPAHQKLVNNTKFRFRVLLPQNCSQLRKVLN